MIFWFILVSVIDIVILQVLEAPFDFIIVVLLNAGLYLMINSNYVRPLRRLYKGIKSIDFSRESIDLSVIDELQPEGSKLSRGIIERVKYLLDIIAERIDRVNSETYKGEHDELTGCYNRQHLEVAKSEYEVNHFTVIFIDVNNLKRMNDEQGHEAGDALLKSAARALKGWNRFGDVYRMGGDEFMVVVKGMPVQQVQKLVAEWYPTVGQLNRASDPFKCVLSYGVVHGDPGSSFDTVMKAADDKMYEMKVALKKQFGEPLR